MSLTRIDDYLSATGLKETDHQPCPHCDDRTAYSVHADSEGMAMGKCHRCGVTVAQHCKDLDLGGSDRRIVGVEDLAHKWGLPLAFLYERGLTDTDRGTTIPCRREDGSLLRDKIRTKLEGKDKYIWGPGKGAHPYGLDTVNGHRRVYITEGESDALTLHHLGEAAIGVPGADNTHTIRPEHLDGVDEVVVVPDTDKAGGKLLPGIKRRLEGWPGSIKVLDVAPHKDVNEAFQAGALDVDAVVDPDAPTPLWEMVGGENGSEFKPPEFFHYPYLVKSAVNLTVGDPGTGKSLFMVEQTKQYIGDGCRVMWAGYENTDTLGYYLSTIEGDVAYLDGMKHHSLRWTEENGGPDALLDQARQFRPDILIIDSLYSATALGEINLNSAKDAGRVFDQLERFAQDMKTTVLVIHHTNKYAKSSKKTAVAGSQQIVGRIRGGFTLIKVKAESNLDGLTTVAVGQSKESVAPEVRPIRFCIQGKAGATSWEMPEFYLDGEMDRSLDEILAEERTPKKGKGAGAPKGNTNAAKEDSLLARESFMSIPPGTVFTLNKLKVAIQNASGGEIDAFDKGYGARQGPIYRTIRWARDSGHLKKVIDPFSKEVAWETARPEPEADDEVPI